MRRIGTADRDVDKHGAGKDGFTDGTPGVTAATALDAAWCDAIQEELANAIELSGLTLDSNSFIQLFAAMQRRQHAHYSVTGTGVSSGNKFTLTEEFNHGGFVLNSNEVQVPAAGRYFVTLMGAPIASDTSNPHPIAIVAAISGTSTSIFASGTRFSGDASQFVGVCASGVFDISDPSTQKIIVIAPTISGTMSIPANGGLTIQRVL